MTKRSSDYIPTYVDFAEKQDKMSNYMKENGSPYRTYEVKYIMFGNERTEEIVGLTEADATEALKKSWWMNGIIIDVKSCILKKLSDRELRAAEKEKKEND